MDMQSPEIEIIILFYVLKKMSCSNIFGHIFTANWSYILWYQVFSCGVHFSPISGVPVCVWIYTIHVCWPKSKSKSYWVQPYFNCWIQENLSLDLPTLCYYSCNSSLNNHYYCKPYLCYRSRFQFETSHTRCWSIWQT